jgi:hypothetical protein
MILDVIAPEDCGAKLIDVQLEDPDAKPRAHQPIVIGITYDRCTTGIVLPLIVTVTSGTSQESFVRRIYRRVAPSVFVFTPREGGRHLVRVAECYHQRWQGVLRLDVAGDRLQKGTIG